MKDPEFERFIEKESAGVADSARLRYYGSAYPDLFSLPAEVACRGATHSRRGGLIPLHSDEDNTRARELVLHFERLNPGRLPRCGAPKS